MANEKTVAELIKEMKSDLMKEVRSMVGDKPFLQNEQGSVIHKTRWVTHDQVIICPGCGSNAKKIKDNHFHCVAGCEADWSISSGDVPNKIEPASEKKS